MIIQKKNTFEIISLFIACGHNFGVSYRKRSVKFIYPGRIYAKCQTCSGIKFECIRWKTISIIYEKNCLKCFNLDFGNKCDFVLTINN